MKMKTKKPSAVVVDLSNYSLNIIRGIFRKVVVYGPFQEDYETDGVAITYLWEAFAEGFRKVMGGTLRNTFEKVCRAEKLSYKETTLIIARDCAKIFNWRIQIQETPYKAQKKCEYFLLTDATERTLKVNKMKLFKLYKKLCKTALDFDIGKCIHNFKIQNEDLCGRSEKVGVEADDIISVLTKHYIGDVFRKIVIVSNDGDFRQLLDNPSVALYNHQRRKISVKSSVARLTAFQTAIIGKKTSNISSLITNKMSDILKRQIKMGFFKSVPQIENWIRSRTNNYKQIIKRARKRLRLVSLRNIDPDIETLILRKLREKIPIVYKN